MFAVALYTWLSIRIFRLTRQKPHEIEVVINGLIPSKSDASTKEDSGTTVLLFFGDGSDKVIDSQIVDRGHADEKGEFRASVDRSKVGETLTCRIRHAAYKFKDDKMLVMDYGVFHTAIMEPDFSYIGKGFVRGADVSDLKAYTNDSINQGNNYRRIAFNRLKETGYRLGEVPFLYWLQYYLLGVLAFALDYFILGEYFDRNIKGIVDPLYFSVVTITTLGYGEIVPTHYFTKLLTSLQSISGVVLAGLFLNSLFSGRA